MELLKTKCNYNFDGHLENKNVIIIWLTMLKHNCNYDFNENVEKQM